MNLLKCILTGNRCYKTKQSITPKGVMVHSTGANNPMIRRYVQPLESDSDRDTLLNILGINRYKNDWNHTDPNACVHGFIGKLDDGSIAAIQTLPWTHRGWHAGTGTTGKSANDTHISFEICEDGLSDRSYFEKTKDIASDLTAMLCYNFNLDPMTDGVVICHKEGYNRGIASGHGDVLHWWPKYGYTMDDFRSEVKVKLNRLKEGDNMTYYKTKDDVPSWYAPTINKLIGQGWLKGKGDGILDISEDFCRILTLLDNMGKL